MAKLRNLLANDGGLTCMQSCADEHCPSKSAQSAGHESCPPIGNGDIGIIIIGEIGKQKSKKFNRGYRNVQLPFDSSQRFAPTTD